MKKNIIQITNSERQTFLSCRQRHSFKYVQRLRTVHESSALKVGKLVHYGVETALHMFRDGNGSMSLDALAQAAHTFMDAQVHEGADVDSFQEWQKDQEIGKFMVSEYIHNHLATVDKKDLWAIEWGFDVQLPIAELRGQGAMYAGKVDSIWKHGDQWILEELKTTAMDVGQWVERLELDTQTRGYAYALHTQEKVPYENMMVRWVILKKTMPKPPLVLKNGTVSTDKRQNTTQPMYLAALVEQEGRGLPIKEAQRQVVEHFPKRAQVFHVVEMPILDVSRWVAEVQKDAWQIMESHFHPYYVPVRNMDLCTRPGGYCEYKQVCVESAWAEDHWVEMGLFRRADHKHEELMAPVPEEPMDDP